MSSGNEIICGDIVFNISICCQNMALLSVNIAIYVQPPILKGHFNCVTRVA